MLYSQSRVISEIGNSNILFYNVFITVDIIDNTEKSQISDLLGKELSCEVICKFYAINEFGIE